MHKTKLEWAKHIAAMGFRIVPLHHMRSDGTCSCNEPECTKSKGKHPIWRDWPERASSDAAVIEKWFSANPDMNYGCVAGSSNFVLDIDIKGTDGFETVSKLLGVERDEIHHYTFTVKTPSGGEHLYFCADRVYANSVKKALGDGLDVRSGNGFVVGPGSVLYLEDEFEPDRFVPVSYEVIDDRRLVDLPESIKNKMRETMERSENAQSSVSPDTIDSDSNVQKAIKLLKDRAPSISGQGGNEQALNTANLVRDFNISEERCVALLTEETDWNDRCDPPWDVAELETIVRNAYRYAKRPMGSKATHLLDDDDVFGVSELPDGFHEVSSEDKSTTNDSKKRFTFYDGSMVLTVDKHYDFIIDSWLPAKNYTIVLGARNSGKTTIIMDVVGHIVSDAPWHGTETDEGWSVVYLAGEDFEGVKARYEAWCADHQDLCTFNDVTDMWEVKDPSRIQFIDMSVNLLDKDEVLAFGKAVRELVNSIRIKRGYDSKICFVIDTWQRMTAAAVGGQSSDESMQTAISNVEWLADQFSGPCIIAAHPPKANTTTMAGSAIIENRSDAIWAVEPLGAGARKITVTRVKGSEDGNWKNVTFQTSTINGTDHFNRQRTSVTIQFSSGSVEHDKRKVVQSTMDWQRSQSLLELIRDILAKKQKYNPLNQRVTSQNAITELVMELYDTPSEIKEVSTTEGETGVRDTVLRDEWKRRIADLGFKEDELKRPALKKIKIPDHPFFRAMDSLRSRLGGVGEIGTSGSGITWAKDRRRYILSYGPIDKSTLVDKADEELVAPDQNDDDDMDDNFGDEI